ncbi:MAG TPA: hypothetical protein VHP58_05670 [Alphaproteobacteria bacterium]|nr:hypothetical protein [Alphaproteobacteria bacterium]
MLKYVGITAVAAMMAGCVGNTPIVLEDGSAGYSVYCDGGYYAWGDCYEEAGKLCGSAGYKKLEKTYEKGRESDSYGVYKAGRGSQSRTTHNRNMIIACNAGSVSATVPVTKPAAK